MLNIPNYLSIIIHNNCSEQLTRLINLLTEQIKDTPKKEFIIINNQLIKQKNIDKLEIVNLEYYEHKIPVKLFNYQGDSFDYAKLEDFITGDLILFISSNYLPDHNWFTNIIKAFTNSSINVLIGDILDSSKEEKSIANKLEYLPMWQRQMSNLAIRTKFLKQIKYFSFLNKNNYDSVIYSRILRELEEEINYLPNTIVRENLEQS